MESGNPMGWLGNKKLVFVVGIIGFIFSFLLINFLIHLGLELLDYAGQGLRQVPADEMVAMNIKWEMMFVVQWKYKQIYMLFYLVVLGLLSKMYYEYKMNYGKLDKGQHGTSEFETVKELKKQYKIIPAKTKEYEGAGGVIISGLQEGNKPYRLLIDESPVHTMVIGITRSGKGETFVFPMIDVLSRASKKPSLLINDPKGELAGASYQTLVDRGYEVHVLNLIQQHMGMGFNPLQLVVDAWKKGDISLAEQYASSVAFSLYHNPNAKEPMWDESAASLVTAIILGITEDSIALGREERVNMYSVASFLSSKGSDNKSVGQEEVNALDEYFKARDKLNPATLAYSTSNFAGGQTRASIFTTAMSKLQVFMLEPNAKMTSYNSLNLTDIGFGDNPVAVFMVTPDYDESNHVLASIFVSQLYRANAERSTLSPSGRMKRDVHCILDEVGNMPAIDGLPSMVTVGAGRGFRFHLIVQAYPQMKSKYGDDSDTIIGNCSNQIYILTLDKSTAEHYSGLIGTKTITDVSRSGKLLSSDKQHSESVKERPLLMADELMQLKEGQSVVVRANKRQDMRRNKIVPKPIFNENITASKFRWEYLSDDFDNSKSILELPLMNNEYHDIVLSKMVFTAIGEDNFYVPMVILVGQTVFDDYRLTINALFISCGLEEEKLSIDKWSYLHLFSFIVNQKLSSRDRGVRILFAQSKQHLPEEVVKEWEEKLTVAPVHFVRSSEREMAKKKYT